ncbi:uncharacterized protein LOC117341461 [Pecten maximus]|uniref:uncharacterized protein LOC117341461 n=1 Tax=Pecten maximus TaxID=6579 RepID=UPI0014589D5C|nr:uncharacterized protein LOC117341461 [Pecten maximus]
MTERTFVDTMATARFASVDGDELKGIIDNIDSANTKRTTMTSVKLFREYLSAKNYATDFENFTQDDLDSKLSSFYVEMRNKNGDMYKKSTLISYRHGLQRHLEKCRSDNIDITNHNIFRKSSQAFKGMSKELKRQGLAAVNHHPPVSDGDLKNLYHYLLQGNLEDAQLLQYKVFIDLMLHFGRRGRENLATLTRQDFAVGRDDEGALYVYKTTDELTKNHQDDSQKSSDGRMYEVKESMECPVRSFVKYIRRLNPNCSRLFQKARKDPKDRIFYDNIPLGHNRIGSFMTEISKAASLSVVYTNHSLRATTVHVLDSAHIPSRHIMTVTGHKSESSLKTYSGKTDNATKRLMSETINKKCESSRSKGVLVQKTTNVTHQQVSDDQEGLQLTQLTNSQTETFFSDIGGGFDENTFLDFMDPPPASSTISAPNPQSVESQNPQTVTAPSALEGMPMPSFANCSNFTINFNFVLPKQ